MTDASVPHVHSSVPSPTGLTRKIGPLPAYVWAILGAATIAGGYYFIQRRKSATTGTTGTGSNVIDGSGDGIATDDSGALSGTSTTGNAGATGTVDSGETNAQWAANAANGLAGQGTYTPTQASNALTDYLNGKALDPTEQAIVNSALSQYGQPPQGVLPINTTPNVGLNNSTLNSLHANYTALETALVNAQHAFNAVNATYHAHPTAANGAAVQRAAALVHQYQLKAQQAQADYTQAQSQTQSAANSAGQQASANVSQSSATSVPTGIPDTVTKAG